MNRTEACAELARRIGYQVDEWPTGFYARSPNKEIANGPFLSECSAWLEGTPNFFVSRVVGAELVAWIKTQSVRIQLLFCMKLELLIYAETVYGDWQDTFAILLATPEQITLAACAALSIEVE